MKNRENDLIWEATQKKQEPLNEDIGGQEQPAANPLEEVARELYSKYGHDSHELGNLLIQLVIYKGKFSREKKPRKIKNQSSYGMDPGREQQRTRG